MSVLPPFEYHRPTSLDEALATIDDEIVPYCGGTELLMAMRSGLFRPRGLVDLKAIRDLALISDSGDELVLGASVTHHQATKNPVILQHSSTLSDVLARVGNPRVRASGTVGGNICFAEPKSDVTTIGIALGAHLNLKSVDGERQLSIEDFLIGPYTTAKADNELLTEIRIPKEATSKVAYEKFQTMERPTVGVAAAEMRTGDLRVVIGAVGPTPMKFEGIDDPSAIADQIEVIPDASGSEDYKRHVTEVFVRRVLTRLGRAA